MAKKKAASRTATKKKPATAKTAKKPTRKGAKTPRTPRKIATASDDEPPGLSFDEPYPQPPIEADDAAPVEDGIVADQLGDQAAEASSDPPQCDGCELCEDLEPTKAESTEEVATIENAEETAVVTRTAPTMDPESAAALELEHYHQIRDLNVSVRSLYFQWKDAKDDLAVLKKDLDARNEELQKLISRGPETPLPLFANCSNTKSEPTAATPAAPATPATPPEWKRRLVTVLNIAAGAVKYLDESGIGTLGDLADFWASGRELHSLPNIGPETAAAIADAYADYANEHPELYGEPPIVAEASTAEESIETDGDEPDDEDEDGEPLFDDRNYDYGEQDEGDEPLFDAEDGPEEEEATDAA